MKTVTQITRYSLDGQEFSTLQEVKTHVENDLFVLVDKLSQSLSLPFAHSVKACYSINTIA